MDPEAWIIDEQWDGRRVLAAQGIPKGTVVDEQNIGSEMAEQWFGPGGRPAKPHDIMRIVDDGNCSKHYRSCRVAWVTNQAVRAGGELTKVRPPTTAFTNMITAFEKEEEEEEEEEEEKAKDRVKCREVWAKVQADQVKCREVAKETREMLRKANPSRLPRGDRVPTYMVHGIKCNLQCSSKASVVGSACRRVVWSRTSEVVAGQVVYVVDLPTAESTQAIPVYGVVERQDGQSAYIKFAGSGIFEYDNFMIDTSRYAAALRALESDLGLGYALEDPNVMKWSARGVMRPFMERRAQIDKAEHHAPA